MSVFFKDNQTESTVALDQVAIATPTKLEALLQSINEELTPPLRMVASSPNDRTVTIENIEITNPITSRKWTIPPIAGTTIPAFTSGTVTFPATSGGTVVVTPGLDVTLTVSSGNFIKAGLSLDTNGDIGVTFGTQGASEAAAGTPALPGGSHAIGFVVLQNLGGTIQNIGSTNIRQYAGGGGGSGSGSGDGEINYVTNPTAEFTINDWSTYADAAATTPVDGTGGSPSVTFTRSTVSGELIRGDGVFKLAKDAANRQGQGFSTPFTIDKADNNKMLKLELEYRTTANYASGDLGFFIYDVDTSALITPSVSAVAYTSGISKMVVTWPSHATSVNYRLIGHITSTNALAWDFIFDRIIVGPGVLGVIGLTRREWLYNTQAAANTNDTSSFGNGSGGVAIRAHTATTTLRVQSAAVIAPEDEYVLEVSVDGNEWLNATMAFPALEVSGQFYGMEILQVTGSNQQLDVRFYADGATPTDTWASVNSAGYKWRIRFRKDTADTNVGYNFVSYLTNTSTAVNTNNTTSFGEGQTGVAILAHTTGNVALRVQHNRLITPTDSVILKVSLDGNEWKNADDVFPYLEAGASQYGMRWEYVTGSNQTIDVVFYKDGATGTETWTSINSAGWKWRLEVVSSASPVGFGFANTVEGGLVSASAQSFGGLKTFTAGLLVSDGSAASPSIGFSSDNDGSGTGFYRSAANQIGIATNGVGRVFIDADGNVGIGAVVSSGAYGLGLTKAAPIFAIKRTADTNGSSIVFEDSSNTDVAYVSIATSSGSGFFTGGLSNALCLRSEGYGIQFGGNGATPHMTIDSNGRTGIGTSNPNQDLGTFWSSAYKNFLMLGSGATGETDIPFLTFRGNRDFSNSILGAINFQDADSTITADDKTSSFISGTTGTGAAGDRGGHIDFWTRNPGSSLGQRLRIEQDGSLRLFSGTIKRFGKYLEAKSADYTVTDTDGISVILMTRGASNRTITLPVAGNNVGRQIDIFIVDDNTGIVTVDGNGSETINENLTILMAEKNDTITLLCNGTGWHIIRDGRDMVVTGNATAGSQVLSDSTTTKVTVYNAARDRYGMWSNTNDQFTAPETGWYEFTASADLYLNFSGTTPSSVRHHFQLVLSTGPTVMAGHELTKIPSNGINEFSRAVIVHSHYLTAGNIVYFNAYMAVTGGTTVTRYVLSGGAGDYGEFAIRKIR